MFLLDPGKLGVRSMGPDVSTRGFADLTDVTVADEDTNSILTDNANRAIQGNLRRMQVAHSGGRICNQCKVLHLVAKKFEASHGVNIF